MLVDFDLLTVQINFLKILYTIIIQQSILKNNYLIFSKKYIKIKNQEIINEFIK